MKRKELKSTDVLAMGMATETIARMFGLKIKPKAITVEFEGQYMESPDPDWLDSMSRSLPEVDVMNAKFAVKTSDWIKIIINIRASFEYGGGQLSPRFTSTIFKVGSMIWPFAIAMNTQGGSKATVIRYEWVPFCNEPIQSGVADPHDFKDNIVMS